MLFKRIFKSKKPVNNIGISSSKQSVQIPNIHEIALKRAFFVYYDDKFSHIHRYACGESGIVDWHCSKSGYSIRFIYDT